MHFIVKSSTVLIEFLYTQLSTETSKNKLKWALEHNLCRVNCRLINNASFRLKQGDKIFFALNFLPDTLPSFTGLKRKDLLLQHKDFIIINKPPWVNSDSTELKENLEKLVNSEVHLVHRLDRGTTGTLIFAKSKSIKERFIQIFNNKKIDKTYYALAEGFSRKESGYIENFLGPVQSLPGQKKQGACQAHKGKLAQTEWQLKLRTPTCSLFSLKLITGRTHQIRCHLSQQLKCPILGDGLYGEKFLSPYVAMRPMLHAFSLDFEYENERLFTKAPLDKDFYTILKKLHQNKKSESFLSEKETKYLNL
ncbi:MAG: RNA pseudouridine synthase [Chlamydiales bacterium]|nr:RNA pseudouridine synthase [Chlamydiales bacterium]